MTRFSLLDVTTAIEDVTTEVAAPGANVFIGRFLSILTTMGFYVGIVFLGIAGFHWVMQMREQEPERKFQIILWVVSGAALMSLGTILRFFFADTGIAEYIKYALIF